MPMVLHVLLMKLIFGTGHIKQAKFKFNLYFKNRPVLLSLADLKYLVQL